MTMYATGKPGLAFTLCVMMAMNGASFAVAAGEEQPSAEATTENKNPEPEPAAQPAADGATRHITVTATRTEHRPDEVPASVSVLTAKDLKHKHRQNVEDMLRDLEGLDFSRQAGVAHQGYPTIRGVGGSPAGATTQVLIDGLPQDAAASSVLGHGGLNFIDTQDIERVEVVRGPVSALYGYGAIGGVINVIPKRWQGAGGIEINSSYGSNDTWIEGGAFGTATEKFDVRVSFYDARSDGFIAVPERNRFGQIDYGSRDWTDHKAGLNGGYLLDSRQELTFNYYEYETDSAIYGGDRPFDRQRMDGKSVRLGYQIDISDATSLKALYQVTRLTQKWNSDQEEWYGDIGNFGPAFSFTRRSDTKTLTVELSSRLSPSQHLIAGISYDKGEAKELFSFVRNSEHTTQALYLQDEITLGAFSLTAGLRYDRIELSPITSDGVPINGNSSVDNVVSPRLGVTYKVTDTTSFYSSIGSAFLPAQNKYKFVQPSATRVDNPDLDPERSVSFEIGMRNKLPIGKLRSTVYRTNFKDKIVLGIDPVSGMDQWQNRALRKVLGVEIAYEGDLGNGWYPYANYSHIKAEDQAFEGAEFTEATRVAPNKFNFGFTFEPGDRWSANFNGRWVDSQYFFDLSDEQKGPSYFQGDALVKTKLPGFSGKLDGYLAVNNITDKKYYPFNVDEWADGRTFSVGVNGKF